MAQFSLVDFVLIFTENQHSLLCRCPVLAMANVSVRRPSVTLHYSIILTQASITKPLLSGPWRTLLPGSVKAFYEFESGHPDRGG